MAAACLPGSTSLRVPAQAGPELTASSRPHACLPTSRAPPRPCCSEAVRWLGRRAEDLGVEIFPGFAGARVIYGPAGDVHGVQVRRRGRQRAVWGAPYRLRLHALLPTHMLLLPAAAAAAGVAGAAAALLPLRRVTGPLPACPPPLPYLARQTTSGSQRTAPTSRPFLLAWRSRRAPRCLQASRHPSARKRRGSPQQQHQQGRRPVQLLLNAGVSSAADATTAPLPPPPPSGSAPPLPTPRLRRLQRAAAGR